MKIPLILPAFLSIALLSSSGGGVPAGDLQVFILSGREGDDLTTHPLASLLK